MYRFDLIGLTYCFISLPFQNYHRHVLHLRRISPCTISASSKPYHSATSGFPQCRIRSWAFSKDRGNPSNKTLHLGNNLILLRNNAVITSLDTNSPRFIISAHSFPNGVWLWTSSRNNHPELRCTLPHSTYTTWHESNEIKKSECYNASITKTVANLHSPFLSFFDFWNKWNCEFYFEI